MSDMQIEQFDDESLLGKRNRNSCEVHEEKAVNAAVAKRRKTESVSSSQVDGDQDISFTPSEFALEFEHINNIVDIGYTVDISDIVKIICSYKQPKTITTYGSIDDDDFSEALRMHRNVVDNYMTLRERLTNNRCKPVLLRWMYKWSLHLRNGHQKTQFINCSTEVSALCAQATGDFLSLIQSNHFDDFIHTNFEIRIDISNVMESFLQVERKLVAKYVCRSKESPHVQHNGSDVKWECQPHQEYVVKCAKDVKNMVFEGHVNHFRNSLGHENVQEMEKLV